ncbi:MAG: NADH-quinone oxidoreductase subunit L [Candidatus Bathyarchaeia archaeon]
MLPYAPWFCWFVPIAGSILTSISGRIYPKLRGCLAIVAVGTGSLFSFSMIPDVLAGDIIDWRIPSFSAGAFHLEFGALVDPLGVLMACVINSVGLLVAIFSTEYMRRDPSLSRYWFLIQIFIGGLVLVVVAGDLLSLFIGWEIVGISCSFLVAFWHQDPYKAHYGLKTFMVLRVGDALLLASILMIYACSGTFNIIELQQETGWMLELSKSGFLLITALMLFGGTLAKSALFPLHEWLPDALPASPASFNALTEVLAGAFLVARFLPIFHGGLINGYGELTFFFSAVAWIGVFTAFLAASMAMVQRNVIRVLVYSIISQYAYVMVGLGSAGLMMNPASGYLAANMHLMVDAVSSALLFLAAASLLYATGTQDMFDMGQLKDKMPITFKCMSVGALALMGIPPLSGFWSEEAICGTVLELISEANEHGQYSLVISGVGIYVLLLITTGITAFFTVRMMGLIFAKREGVLEEKVVEEVPALMQIPMVIASAVTVGIGVLAPFVISGFRRFFSSTLYGLQINRGGIIDVIREALLSPGTAATGVALFAAILPAYHLYVSGRIDPVKLTEENWLLNKAHKFLLNRCYIDAFYYKVAHGAITLSQWAYPSVELGCFERFNHKVSENAAKFSEKIRRTQTGILSFNMLGVLFGTVLLAILLLSFGGLF